MSGQRLFRGCAGLLVVVGIAALPGVIRKVNPPAVSRERYGLLTQSVRSMVRSANVSRRRLRPNSQSRPGGGVNLVGQATQPQSDSMR